MRKRFLAAVAAVLALCAASCNSGGGGGNEACTWQSSSASGGLCSSSYGCNDGTQRSVNCAGDECVCSADDRTGARFTSPGFCALSREARYPIFASRCLPPPATYAGAAADARPPTRAPASASGTASWTCS